MITKFRGLHNDISYYNDISRSSRPPKIRRTDRLSARGGVLERMLAAPANRCSEPQTSPRRAKRPMCSAALNANAMMVIVG